MTTAKKAAAKPAPAPADEPRVESAADERVALRTAGIPTTEQEIIAARTSAIDEKTSDRYRKDYVIQARAWDEAKGTPGEEDLHHANRVDTLQQALLVGLHPQEEATFDGAEELPGKSVQLSYSVAVKPAGLDEKAHDAVTPRKALLDLPGNTTVQSAVDESAKESRNG
jgi:hypothetical protein